MNAELEGAAVDLVANEEEDDDWSGEVALEEAFGVEVWATNGLGRLLVRMPFFEWGEVRRRLTKRAT